MNSRERVMAALQHREPDRVPFDCTFGYGAYERLRQYLGFGPELKPSSPSLTVRPPAEFLEALHIDLYYLGLGGPQSSPVFEYGMETYTDEWGVTYRKIETPAGLQYELAGHPLADATVEALGGYNWPDPYDPARVENLGRVVCDLFINSGFALVGRFSTSIFEQAFALRGLERWMIDLATDPDFAGALMDRLTNIAIGMVEAGLKTCGRYIQILRLAGDDMGHQQGMLVSPEMFRRLIKPRFSRLYHAAKALLHEYNPHAKMMAHTDGDVYPIIRDYIEMGLDVLNPVQPYVAEMDHTRLKREFGNRLSFHAGIDLQHVLPFGTPEEVRAEVIKTIQTLGPGGGYIIAPTHYLTPDVPPENVIALRDAVLAHGQYPLDKCKQA
jgi:uroporphyrinogen decarboxylase